MTELRVSPGVTADVIRVRGRVHTIDRLEPARTALVVIDMQNIFVEPGQMLEVPAARDIVGNINRLAAAGRAAGATVVWVRMTLDHRALDAWSVFLPLNGLPEAKDAFAELEHDKPSHRLWADLDFEPTDLFIDKCRFSAFIAGSSDLQAQLDARQIDTLLIVGTLTNVCCESTGRDAMMLNYRVLMVDDANATTSETAHRATLDNFLTYFGDVQTTEQVLELFAATQ